MSGFKVSMPKSPLEQRAYEQRLEQLGIEVRADGTIDESSVERLRLGDKAGLAALKAVTGPDGVLDAQAASKLDANLKLLDRMVGKSAAVSADQSNTVRAAALAMDGLAKTLDATADRASRNEPPNQEQLDRIGRSIEHTRKQWAPWAEAGANLANVDASALAQFASSFAQLNEAASALGIELSKQREFVLETGAPAAKEVRTMLSGLSSTIHQLGLIRDASLLVAGRPASESSKSIDALVSSLQASLAPVQQAAVESAQEKAARVKALLTEIPAFASGPVVETLATFMTSRFAALTNLDAAKGPAVLLIAYDIPQSFAPPNGKQQLVVTPLGLRAVGVDPAGPTRIPTPSELASAGLEWSKIEEATQSLLQRVSKLGAEIEPITITLNKEDRLYTNGNRASVDMKQLDLDWTSVMKHKDPKTLAQEMARVFNEYASQMSAGEVRDFARRALRDMANQSLPPAPDRVHHSRAQIEVMDAILAQLDRFPFHQSQLKGMNSLSEGVRRHLTYGYHDMPNYQQWLDRWHIESSAKFD